MFSVIEEGYIYFYEILAKISENENAIIKEKCRRYFC